MTKATHMPGPWEWVDEGECLSSAPLQKIYDDFWGRGIKFDRYPDDAPPHGIVLRCEFQGGPDEADARLIAAAPDLIEALTRLISDILEYERINNLVPSPGKKNCWQGVTKAIAAIAKAGGRAP